MTFIVCLLACLFCFVQLATKSVPILEGVSTCQLPYTQTTGTKSIKGELLTTHSIPSFWLKVNIE